MLPLLVALLGSPRPQGACARLLSAFCRGARGWRIRQVHLSRLHIHPCQGCGSCQRTRVCRYRDDMVKLIRWLDQADAVVLAAPVYFYGLPSQTKAVVDRCHPLWNDPYWQRRPRRPAFLLAACGSNRLSEFAVLRREARSFFNTIGCRLDGEQLVPGLQLQNARRKLARAAVKSRMLAVRNLERSSWKNPSGEKSF